MQYDINKLSRLAGVSSRTLRYYDEIGLLVPSGKTEGGYRLYTSQQVDALQQIMFYRSLGVELKEIKRIMEDKSYNPVKTLEGHLIQLHQKKQEINGLIEYVNLTLKSMKGDIVMTDKEKFSAFKKNMVEENEKKFGKEIRKMYGEETVEKSNEKLLNMTQEEYSDINKLTEKLNETLKQAVLQGDPSSKTAMDACALHQQWIKFYWPTYSKQAHLALCEGYTLDERFKAYYEKITPGCAEFLFKAMKIYLA